MIDPQTYYLFLLTALVLVLSPGPDTVLILSRTIATGTGAGMMTLLGTQAGNVVHALLAGLGVSSIVLLFPIAFDILKYLGAAYLVYLATMAWRASATLELDTRLSNKRGGALRYFYQGLTNNLVNPKMIPFFIALFPQFVRPENGAVALQSLSLGMTLAGMAIVWIGAIVLLVGRFRSIVAGSTTFLKLANRLAAVTFFGLAARLVVQER
ncbi:MAG: LysE family translocator [Rhizobiaceae bacterium]|nr:LysE family translocator [Rhizobiaceae bacterium]